MTCTEAKLDTQMIYRPGGLSERPNASGELRRWQPWRHRFVPRQGTLEEELEWEMSRFQIVNEYDVLVPPMSRYTGACSRRCCLPVLFTRWREVRRQDELHLHHHHADDLL